MAGFKQLAANIIVGTTALGSVGGGGYYLANSAWLPAQITSRNATATPTGETETAKSASGQPADLDAVASAWAQPVSVTQGEALADVSATARSASVSLARAEEAAAAATLNDRYGIHPSTLTTPATTEPVAHVEVQAQQVAELNADEPAPEESSEYAAVTRGQEPNDDATAAQEQRAADAFASDTQAEQGAAAGDELAEPRALALPAGETGRNITSARAREAFHDQAAAASADPYGASTAPAKTPNSSAGADSSGTVNPFAAKAAGSAAQARPEELIESLPAISTVEPTGAAGFQPATNGFGAPSPRAARAANGLESVDIGKQVGTQQTLPIGTLHESDNSNLPGSSSGLIGAGQSDSASIGGTGKPGERALEGPQNSTLTIQKFAPGEIQVGKTAKFVIQVRNGGTQAANEVVVRDEVPQGTRLVSTTPSAQPNGNQLIWQLGKLSAGEERTLEMQLEPVAEGEIGSVATVAYSVQASVKTRCTKPQLTIRMTAPEKVMIGQEQRVRIELKNPGSGDASGVMLFENVPQNVRHAAGPALEFEIGTLRAGETRELELVLVAEKAGKVANVLTARADGNLQVQQQVEFEVIAPALAVAVNGPGRRYLERPATYEVSVENPGTAPAHDVQIVTKLPKGLRFVRANNMGEYDTATHAVYWSLAELPEGESGTVELVAMPIETGAQTLEVESRAGQGLVDQAQQQIIVEGLAAIMFEVRDLEDPIEVGGETGYEIRVVNQGTKAATNVRVAVNLPPGMKVVSAEGETQYAVQGSTLVFEPISDLAPKADSLYSVRVQGIQPGDQRVSVEVNTDDLGQPIRREESTRVFGDE